MSVSKTLTFSAAEDLLESALLRPTQVITKGNLSGVRSYDRVSAFKCTTILSLSFRFFADCIKWAGMYLVGNNERAQELKARVSVVQFGFGGWRSVRAKSGYLINTVTSIALLVLSPIYTISATVSFAAQGLYELIQEKKVRRFQAMLPKEAMETVFRICGGARGEVIEEALKKNRETIEEYIGEKALWLVHKLISIDMPPLDREEGFEILCDILGEELANYACSLTEGELITQEALFVAIESLFISAILTKIYEKKVNFTEPQKEHARQFLQESAKVLSLEKSLDLTFKALNRTAKSNLVYFSRTVRPWLAIEFSREFPHLQRKLLGMDLKGKLEGNYQGRKLLRRIDEQLSKTREVTLYSSISCAACALTCALTHFTGIAIVIFGLSVQTLYSSLRNNIAYGYLDTKGRSFDVWEATPSSIKGLYNFFKGKSSPSKKLEEHSPKDVVTYAEYIEMAREYFHHALFA